MKKLLAILAVAGVMAACNNNEDANNADTPVAPVETPAVTDTLTVDTTGAATGGDTATVR